MTARSMLPGAWSRIAVEQDGPSPVAAEIEGGGGGGDGGCNEGEVGNEAGGEGDGESTNFCKPGSFLRMLEVSWK